MNLKSLFIPFSASQLLTSLHFIYFQPISKLLPPTKIICFWLLLWWQMQSHFKLIITAFNSSDDQVVRAYVSRAVDTGLIPSRVKSMTLKLIFTASLLMLSIKGTVWRTSRQVYLLCRWEKLLMGFPHLGVVDRWPATPHWACYSALILFSRDMRINVKLNAYTCCWSLSSRGCLPYS